MGQFKNLTQAQYDLFKQHYPSNNDSLVWPTLEELIAHSQTRNRDGSNVEYASEDEIGKRFARSPRAVITPCEKEIISVIVDVVTLFLGGREWIRHRSLQQIEEYIVHSGIPLRDASRCLNVLHFGTTIEVPKFTVAVAILRVLKFAFKGGGVAFVYTIWGIIVKNLSWKDLILFGVEIGTEWAAFFATDGVAAIAMIVQEIDRSTWLVLDLTKMISCIQENGFSNNPPSNKISQTDYFGLCVQAIDFPNPKPTGYLQKTNINDPDYFVANNTLLICTDDEPPNMTNKRYMAVQGMGYMTGGKDSLTFNFQAISGNQEIVNSQEVVLNGKYGGRDFLGLSTSDNVVISNITVPQTFQKISPNDPKALHFIIQKVNVNSNSANEAIYDKDQIILKSKEKSVAGENYYLSIIYDATYNGRYYVGFSKDHPQVWTLFKNPFNP